MASSTINGRVVGLEDLTRRLEGVKRGIRNKLLRKATKKGSQRVLAAAKARADRAAFKYFSVRQGKVIKSGYTLGQLASLSTGPGAKVRETLRSLKENFGAPSRRRTGTLKKSLGIKMTTTRRGTVLGVIGPRRGFKTQVGTTGKGKPIYEDPANIAHLVEFGHGGPHPAPPHPFMRPAWQNSASQVAAIYRDVLGAGIAELGRGGSADDGGSID